MHNPIKRSLMKGTLMQRYRLLLLLVVLTLLVPQAAPLAAQQSLQYVQLGSYPTTREGEKEPILWMVLQNNAEGLLLLSEYVLDAKPVQESGNYNGFEISTLKTWLETEFAQTAFSAAEQQLIARKHNDLLVSLPSVELLRKKDGGFFDEAGVMAKPTAYALAQGVTKYARGDASYWVSNRATSNTISQRRVLEQGKFGYARASYKDIGIRPVLYLLPGALDAASGMGSQADPLRLELPELAAALTPEAPAEPEEPETPEEPEAESTEAGEAQSPQAPAQQGEQPAQQGEADKPASTKAQFTEGFPELTPAGFLPEGQAPYVFQDEENGVWRYASQNLRLVITRIQDKDKKLRWFETQIFCQGEDFLQMYLNDPGNRRRMAPMEKIAKAHKLVYAMNGDYYIYRVNRGLQEKNKVAIGRVAREGKVFYDEQIRDGRKVHPNLDVLALYPDHRMSVHPANEKSAETLIKEGARDVLSFGPWLVRDGQINKEGVAGFGVTQQPRAGLGMVAPGHFVHIVVESRTSKSKGVNTAWLADRFMDLHCQTAFNLDGGQTAVLIFMGQQLNEIGKYDNKTNSREQNEVMGIGIRQDMD